MRTDARPPDAVYGQVSTAAASGPGLENLPAAVEENQVFQLEVQLDLQRERALLFKVMLVLLTVVALMLLREWALRFFP